MKSTLKDGGGKNLLFESTIFTGIALSTVFFCLWFDPNDTLYPLSKSWKSIKIPVENNCLLETLS